LSDGGIPSHAFAPLAACQQAVMYAHTRWKGSDLCSGAGSYSFPEKYLVPSPSPSLCGVFARIIW